MHEVFHGPGKQAKDGLYSVLGADNPCVRSTEYVMLCHWLGNLSGILC